MMGQTVGATAAMSPDSSRVFSSIAECSAQDRSYVLSSYSKKKPHPNFNLPDGAALLLGAVTRGVVSKVAV
jgi:hypothetical protein